MEREHNLKPVLSPRRFLSNEERMLPRHDARKEKLKKDIQNGIMLSKGYPDFHKTMQKLGYQIEKGRGICFIDSKKVRVKGSEVGFPLSKIEKMLSLLQNQPIKPDHTPLREIEKRVAKAAPDEEQHKLGNGKEPEGQMITKWEIVKVSDQPVGDIPLKRKKKKKYRLHI